MWCFFALESIGFCVVFFAVESIGFCMEFFTLESIGFVCGVYYTRNHMFLSSSVA